MMWGERRARTANPEELMDLLGNRLKALNLLLQRLQITDEAVSPRELIQARSRTALSCRLNARLQRQQALEPDLAPMSTQDEVFGNVELLEHMLSFLGSPSALARVGAVCTTWYLASRMQTLWEAELRRSGRLIDFDMKPLPLPLEEEWTLFETAARIERHGCRPVEGQHPEIGTIDSHVDDLAAYVLENEVNESTGALQPLNDVSVIRACTYIASHATRGRVSIRHLNFHQSRLSITALRAPNALPLPNSPHLQPVRQIIVSDHQVPSVYVVQPALTTTLEHVLKKEEPLDRAHAHSILCQLANALRCLHEQGFVHGAVLLNNIYLQEAGRTPFVVLDKIYNCRKAYRLRKGDLRLSRSLPHGDLASASDGQGGTTAGSPSGFDPHGSAQAAAEEQAASDVDQALNAWLSDVENNVEMDVPPSPTFSLYGTSALGSLLEHSPVPMTTQAWIEELHQTPTHQLQGSSRAFADLLTWGWSAYDRLGIVIEGLHAEHVDAESPVPYAELSFDVRDLGRVLLRMLLQPYKVGPTPELPPSPADFSESLQELLLKMLHRNPARRPTAQQVRCSAWTQEQLPGVPRPLCCCWKLADALDVSATPSDLRLLSRREPKFEQVNLANSPAVTDEWLEVLSCTHADSLRGLDISGCQNISCTQRPLRAMSKLRCLQVLRLPSEKWGQHELAECLTALPALRAIDEQTYADLYRERDALRAQCDILANVRVSGR
ncbi:hypothetical protein AB1Y20_015749 [Prymnesium parvum]|uniref:Protein kinase domain-containing protein n=1 Tax=Prymnesium parvum TaxID=97485 RepID=A0AB34K2C8_PRYPA|mmetsp:Transcript_10085/g.24954  ORF Transcript_10085/g.24954 Transcript_10085/m.24954 type:complete len:724 (+) Transcript_10085:160-2331(+)